MNLTLRKSVITDRQENTIEQGVRLDSRPVFGNRGTVCLVSAQCEAGFDPDSAILLYADLPNAPYLAIENHSPFWCRPVWGDDLSSLPDRVQELLIRDGDGYLAILPLCGDVFKTVICGTAEGLAFLLMPNGTYLHTSCGAYYLQNNRIILVTKQTIYCFRVLSLDEIED